MTDELWPVALFPVLVLFALVLFGRMKSTWSSAIALAIAIVLASTVFQAPLSTVAGGMAKGLWLGTWILCVIIPALLLYRLAKQVGMEDMGATFTQLLPRRTDRVLLLAWIFPSFIQGVAGFGTPIAICAPLLLLLGYDKIRAVVLPLVGYHWSVTFGSMGASFYMASLTAGFGISSQDDLAMRVAGLLAVNALVSGALVLLIDGGLHRLRQGLALLLTAGPVMAGTLIVTATTVPAVASLAAGTAGLLVLAASRSIRARSAPSPVPSIEDPATGSGRQASTPMRSAAILTPYAYLLLLVLPVFLIPSSRRYVTELVEFGPSFDRTMTGRGWVNESVDAYLPIPLFGHPGFYIALACLLGWITYRATGLWVRGTGRPLVVSWLSATTASAPTVLILGALAMVLVDTGMITTLATGAAAIAGDTYPVLSPAIGALGSFMTGSSTASNALFAALQSEIATLVHVEPETLVAAQAAGANVGNSIAPVVILIGAASIGAIEDVGAITRRCLPPVAILLAAVVAGVLVHVATQ